MERLKSNFNLNSVDPSCFWRSEWSHLNVGDRPSKCYVVYRFLVLLYFMGTTILNMYRFNLNWYFLFLTNWMYSLQLIYSLVYSIRLIWLWFKLPKVPLTVPPPDSDLLDPSNPEVAKPKLPWPEKLIWVLMNIVLSIPYSVSIGFFLLLYNANAGLYRKTTSALQYVASFLVHGLNSPMSLIEVMAVAVPIQLTHMIFPVFFLLIYVIFAGLYEVSKGVYPKGLKSIYPFLDWNGQPGIAVAAIVGGGLSACVMHAIFAWGMYRLRVLIKTKLCGRRYENSEENGPALVEELVENLNPNSTISVEVDENVEDLKLQTMHNRTDDIVDIDNQM